MTPTPARAVDLNADLGESCDAAGAESDEALLPHVTSVNIACALHGGSPDTMLRLVRLAHRHGVSVGAHPGLPDPWGLGRRALAVTAAEVEALVLYQVGALAAMCAATGATLTHVKPHGALYHLAESDPALGRAIVTAVAAIDRKLIVVGLSSGKLVAAAREGGLFGAAEAFLDRRYQADGQLVPRRQPGAILGTTDEAVQQARRLATQNEVLTETGAPIRVVADTLCIHGDRPGAAGLAQAVRAALTEAGVVVRALHREALGAGRDP